MEKITALTYFEAAQIAVGTERKVFAEQYGLSGYISADDYGLKLCGKSRIISLSPAQMRAKRWSVEPEKPKEIFVWGVSERGSSYLFSRPPQKDEHGGGWFEPAHTCGFRLPDDLNIQQNEPQKYRLVPADEPLIPWRKFNAEEMPARTTKMIITLEDGSVEADTWGGRGYFINNPDDFGGWYCPLDELPKPPEEPENA